MRWWWYTTPMKFDLWFPTLHVVGIVLWVGGLTAVLALLHVHVQADAKTREVLTGVERRVAMLMDLGATLTIATGLYQAFTLVPNAFKTGPWLHIKLTAVAIGLLSVHGIARVKIKKFRGGEIKPVPPVMYLLLAIAVSTAATLGGNPELLRK